MTISRHEFSSLGFVATHDVVLEDELPKFVRRAAVNTKVSVYIWASPSSTSDEFEVLYVGKAGYGIARRLQQHRGGFIHSGAGRSNRALITDWLLSGRSLSVFTRVASTALLFGVQVSLYSSEEEALCECYEPRWNRATFPGSRTEDHGVRNTEVTTGEVPEVVVASAAQISHGDEIVSFLGAVPPSVRLQFQQLAEWIERRYPDQSQKVVRGYSGQPAGCNGTPMLVFARIGPSGKALSNAWVARIPLVDAERDPLTVVFPASAKRVDIDSDLISEGSTGAWRPLDLAAFLRAPETYLK